MKEIITKKGAIIQVSDECFEEMSKYAWYISHGGYARTHICDVGGVWRGKLMSRIIMDAKPGQYVDHIDGNKLNNQLENLRLCTNSQNLSNRQHATRSSSGFWGVVKRGKRWQAFIGVNNRWNNLGTFSTPEEAARVRDAAAVEYFGEFATLNFPEDHRLDLTLGDGADTIPASSSRGGQASGDHDTAR